MAFLKKEIVFLFIYMTEKGHRGIGKCLAPVYNWMHLDLCKDKLN